MQKITNTLGLDVGEKRIGVAIVSGGVAIARRLPTLHHDERLFDVLEQLCNAHDIQQIVVGLPRNLSGDETPQTQSVRQFAKRLEQELDCPVIFQDEALTSQHAEAQLQQAGVGFEKGEVDALAAQAILTDYLEAQGI